MGPKKIILTTHLFLPEFFGGTETLVHHVALTLREKGHSVIVVTGFPLDGRSDVAAGFDEYEIDSLRVLRFKYGRATLGGARNPIRDDYANPLFDTGFQKLLDEFKPDIVHFHHLCRLSITAVDACEARRIPAFLTATDFWPICPTQALLLSDGKICNGPIKGGANCLKHIVTISQSSWVSQLVNSVPTGMLGGVMKRLGSVERDLRGQLGAVQALSQRGGMIARRFALLQKIFVPAKHTQTALENNGIAGVKFRVLPFGLKDHGYIKRVRSRNADKLVLGFIGQLLPHKGLHVLMEAIQSLPAECPILLKVYGKSPGGETQYVKDLRALAQDGARVKFCGTFDNTKIATVLDEIDALVIPSLWHENMPLVSLSAQAAGCPLIASDIGGLSDVVADGKNGLLFKPGSASELCDRVMQLLSDRNLLHRLSFAAVSPPSIYQYVDELESEYRQVIGETS